MTFLEAATEALRIRRVAPQTRKHNDWLLARLAPVHQVPVDELDAPRLLAALRKIEAAGEHSTAHRVCALAGSVIDYALAAGERKAANPVPGLRRILVKPGARSRSAITDPARYGRLLTAIDTLPAGAVRDALRMAPYVFVRPSELRGMRWKEIDFGAGEWLIPESRMKMRKPFVKFLAAPVLEQLKAIRMRQSAEVQEQGFVFPGRVSGCISENIMGLALTRIFYSPEEMTPHGFRAAASTMLHEAGFDHAVIEMALAHTTKAQATYNRALYAAAQRDLHARWAEMVDSMKAQALRDEAAAA